MEEKDKPVVPEVDNEKGTSRRSRKDEEGRDYICGCGKRYLSYPALYTHIKTKHDGQQPAGTQKTGANIVVKRGKPKFEEETLKNIYSYLEKEDLRILGQVDDICKGQVPLNMRIRKESVSKQIYECCNSLMKTQNVELSKNSSVDMVLTIYLLNVGEHVSEKLYDHFVLFAKILRGCYFQHGQQLYRNCFSKKEAGVAYLSTFVLEECKYLPIICDFMVRYYIPNDYKEVNLSLMELLLYDFCNWMKRNGLTYVQLIMNKDYRLETKPILIAKPKVTPSKNGSSKEKELDHNNSNSSEGKKGSESEEIQSENGGQEEDEEGKRNEVKSLPALEEPK